MSEMTSAAGSASIAESLTALKAHSNSSSSRPAASCAVEVVAKIRPRSKLPPEIVHTERNITVGGRTFEATSVVGPDACEAVFFDAAIAPLVESFRNGSNVAILAYGQTGSGKTTLMMGLDDSSDSRGLIWRALRKIFEIPSPGARYEASCTEIYLDSAYDLLSDDVSSVSTSSSQNASKNPGQNKLKLDVHLRKSGFGVPDLTKIAISSMDEGLSVARRGQLKRTFKATKANSSSSRSHFIFTLAKFSENGAPCRIEFVDLAGSEKPSNCAPASDLFKEGIQINQSLLALHKMMEAIRSGNQKVLVRGSLLTQLLSKSLLSPGSRLSFLVCLNPENLHETANSMVFADNIRGVKINANAIASRPRLNLAPRLTPVKRGVFATPGKPNASISNRISQSSTAKSGLKRPGEPLKELQSPSLLKKPALMKSGRQVTSTLNRGPGNRVLSGVNQGTISSHANSTMVQLQTTHNLSSYSVLRDGSKNCTALSPILPSESTILEEENSRACGSPVATVLPCIESVDLPHIGEVVDSTVCLPVAPHPPEPDYRQLYFNLLETFSSRFESVENEMKRRHDIMEKEFKEMKDLVLQNANSGSQTLNPSFLSSNVTVKSRPLRIAAMEARSRLQATMAMSPSVLASPAAERTLALTPNGTHVVNRMSPRKMDKKKAELRFAFNNWDEKRLTGVPTIGQKTARAVVNFREMYGEFPKIEDLERVPSFPWKKFASVHGLI